VAVRLQSHKKTTRLTDAQKSNGRITIPQNVAADKCSCTALPCQNVAARLQMFQAGTSLAANIM